MQSDLRDFLKHSLSERVINVIDRPTPDTNFVEGFVLETNGMISEDLLLIMLQRYYIGAEVTVTDESFHWVKQRDQPTLLLNITNCSQIGGARFFGGDRSRGGIGINITEHPEVCLKFIGKSVKEAVKLFFEPLLRWFRPRRTPKEVARELSEGLRNGEVKPK